MTNLDDLRIRLDQMSERIVSRLKDRSRLPFNEPVYIADAVPIDGRQGISFLQFALEGLEDYHASLGRFEYRDQHPILSRKLPRSLIARVNTAADISEDEITISEEVLDFYRTVPAELCLKSADPKSYGETVYIDADLIELMHERINTVGRYVAQSKFDSNPDILKLVENEDAVKAALRNIKREDDVVENAKRIAIGYNLATPVTERVFRWMIKETVGVEVAYLRCLTRTEQKAPAKLVSKG